MSSIGVNAYKNNSSSGCNEQVITVVDARMGRGKSSAAIRYMNENRNRKRFLYITPYIKEVERICESCGFEQPNNDQTTKSANLKHLMTKGANISATHSLFYLMDDETLRLAREQRYSIIIDESISPIEKLNITDDDFELLQYLTKCDESGMVHWLDEGYVGKFSDYKNMADSRSLLKKDGSLLCVMNPNILKAFKEVFMLTYMFEGQYQKAYLDFFKFPYHIVGVEQDDNGYFFSDKPDAPPPIDYHKMINIYSKYRTRHFCEKYHDLSQNWYARRGRNDTDIKMLRNEMRNFFTSIPDGSSSTRLWTCFKNEYTKLIFSNGRYKNNFLQINARATNEYKEKTDLAYMANRFIDPNISKFFSVGGVVIDRDKFALSEMLQWIWRSAIRDGKPINIYIPSVRMKKLLTDWIDESSRIDNASKPAC